MTSGLDGEEARVGCLFSLSLLLLFSFCLVTYLPGKGVMEVKRLEVVYDAVRASKKMMAKMYDSK